MLVKQNFWTFGHVQNHCLSNNICLHQAKMYFSFFKSMTPHILLTFVCQAMFGRLAVFPPLLVKHFFCYFKTSTTHNNFLAKRQSCLLISNHFVVPKYWTAMFLDVLKRSNICCKANLKCLSSSVWSFGQCLKPGLILFIYSILGDFTRFWLGMYHPSFQTRFYTNFAKQITQLNTNFAKIIYP